LWFRDFAYPHSGVIRVHYAAMPTITALLHTHNDALRIGRALEMLFPCDELLVIDHGSDDGTANVAREYGARVMSEFEGSYFEMVRGDWILSLDPRESISEALAASLFEWKSEPTPENVRAYSVYRREETTEGWVANPIAQTRLVRADWNRWIGNFPEPDASAVTLEGDLLRFVFP
jgi:glycosyltransferase involved in cell wall biosynthesis